MAHFVLTPKWLGMLRATRAATAREPTAPQQTEYESKANDEDMEHDPTHYTSDSSEDKSGSNAEPEMPAGDTNDGIKVIWKHVADKATFLATQAKDAVTEAVNKVRELGFIGTAKAIGEWIKLHPWETALIVVPLVALIATAIALSATGFGPAGIVAGSTAAIIQAGIGNVVAGSIFATCTSAMMGGSGALIVFGGVWLGSTVFMASLAVAWKRWRDRSQLAMVLSRSDSPKTAAEEVKQAAPGAQAAIPQTNAAELSTDMGFPQTPADITDLVNDDVEFDFDMPAMPTNPTADILDFDFCTGANSLDALSEMLASQSNQWNPTALQAVSAPVRKPFTSAHLSPYAKSRVEYSFEHIKLAPKMMVEQACTPWSHPMLYEEYMPRSLQDAHAACALYTTMNDVNSEHVARYITSRAQELVTSATPITPIEILAHTQALMLYQAMLLSSGGIRLWALADTLLPYLEDMGAALLPIAAEESEIPETIPLYPSTVARTAWKSYIFRESARRTVLCAYHIAIMWTLFSGQFKTCSRDHSLRNLVTLSAHLWRATNPFDFAMAWNDKNHFLVKELDFTEVLRIAQPDDLDVFANMMLVGLQGIDDVRGWYHTRGGALL
ncbi:unnamed protein product [Alternaria alternata]